MNHTRPSSHQPESGSHNAPDAHTDAGARRAGTPPSARAVIVGVDDAVCHDLRRAFHSAQVQIEPVFVEHYLAALGEMSGPEPVALVIGQYLGTVETMTANAAAMRELAPETHLLLLVDAYHEDDAAMLVGRGFDEYLLSPFQSAALGAILQSHLPGRGQGASSAADAGPPPPRPGSPRDRTGPADAADCDSDADAAPAADASALEAINHVAERAAVEAVTRPDAPPPRVVEAGASLRLTRPEDEQATGDEHGSDASASDAPATPDTSDAPDVPDSCGAAAQLLGDIDLVERLLDDPAAMIDLAIELIAQRSGLVDVCFGPEAPADSGAQPPEALPSPQPPTQTHRQAPAEPATASSDEARCGLPPVQVRVEYEGQCFGVLAAAEPATVDDLAPWAGWLARWVALQRHVRELAAQALRDELTGLYNRRYFNRFLNRVVRRAQRERFCVTLLMFDIDNFKQYNDRHGYAAGDGVLVDTGRLMQSGVRAHDVVARIGGDEFAVIFWDKQEPRRANSKHPQDVSQAAERFQRAVWEHRFPRLGEGALSRLTISGGLATFPWDGHEPEDLMRVADRMLRQSKSQGKNVITLGPGVAAACGNGEGRTQPHRHEP